MARKRKNLGEILQSWRLIDDRQLKEGQELASKSKKRLDQALVDLGYISENDGAKALASLHDMAFVDLDQPNAVDQDQSDLIPRELITKYKIIPLGKDDNKVTVLVSDPLDLALVDDLRFRLGADIDLALGVKSKIDEYIGNHFSKTRHSIDKLTADMTMDVSMDMSVDSSMDASIDSSMSIDSDSGEMGEAAADSAPVIRLVKKIIQEAVNSRASDIHIEPFANRVRLRYRIDGVCHERNAIPKRAQRAVVARLKIMAGVKVEEKRIPQDGRIKLRIGQEIVDFRVAVCPVYHGETVVLRILRSESAKVGLTHLGMREDMLNTFKEIIERPNGIFLVTGPTGSGKTTTLYSALDALNTPNRKIITAEDPIEYNFKGINQCQINPQIGLTFSNILRSMLRQAPNVILVGEIRDKEVGEVAVQAALTGHLVFSTLHTNDAPSAITRLANMGVQPFLVASSLQAVLAQRLVRVLCEYCKTEDTNPDSRYMHLCGFTKEQLQGQKIYKPGGCTRCSNTGYRGRQGIYELMIMNGKLRELTFKQAPLTQIRRAAEDSGMRNLLGDGKLKILDGITSLEEVARITQVGNIAEMEDVHIQPQLEQAA